MPYRKVLVFRGPDAASRATRALGVLVVVTLAVLTTTSVFQLRNQARVAALKSAQDHAYALAAHASQAFAAADSIALGVVRAITSGPTITPAQLEQDYGSFAEHQLLVARQSGFEGIEFVTVVSATGRLVNSSLVYPPPQGIDMSDREGFHVAKTQGRDAVHIAAPVQNRLDGRWTIYVSRRLANRDGQFLGVVLVGLSPEYFSKLYSEMRPDQEKGLHHAAAITLLRKDGAILARSPSDSMALGRIVSTAGHYRDVVKRDPLKLGTKLFEPWDAAPDEDGCILVGARDIRSFPLVVAEAVHEDYYLAAWRDQAESIAALSAVALIFLVGTFTTLVGVLRRRERSFEETERLRIAAEKASQAKTNFLATVSHEVRTPLNGILGTADLLIRSDLQPKQHQLASTLLASGRNLLAIISDILDLSKIEAEELTLETEPFSPREVVYDVLSLFASYAAGKGLGLSMHVDPQVPQVLEGDGQRVRQILGNLVSNAIKFSDVGEVRIGASWPVGQDGAHCLRFEVVDTGVGIAEEARERIFQPFAQADESISRRFGGTGLGLAISKRLVTLMGGEIDFADRVDAKGTCFWFQVPLPETTRPVPDVLGHEYSDWTFAHSGPSPLISLTDDKPLDRAEAHVLVVEDNSVNAMVVEAQLQRLGCSCDIAMDGEEAIQRLSTGSYQLVLMDCMLPGISGFETTRRWRQVEAQRGLSRLPIVALTANALASNLAETAQAGMDDFLTKPCTLDKLEAVLRLWLQPFDPAKVQPGRAESSSPDPRPPL